MRARAVLLPAITALLIFTGTASAATVERPATPAPSWFTDELKRQADAAGPQGVPVDDHSVLDVCPGVSPHENAVGTGTCLVHPFGCTANFVYYDGSGARAPAVADGTLHLGTAGHCVERSGQPVYGAISTPGVGAAIVRIGTVTKLIDKYDDDGLVRDFASIRIDEGLAVEPASPVGGPQGIYDGCEAGQPLVYYGHGYEIAVAQGKPGGGAAAHWYQDGFGYLGTAFGGDSGSGVLHADGRAAGDLTAIILFDPSLAYVPGEVVGTRVTWILGFLGPGYSLVNEDRSLARDTTTTCPASGGSSGGGNGKGKGNGNGKENGKGNGKGSATSAGLRAA